MSVGVIRNMGSVANVPFPSYPESFGNFVKVPSLDVTSVFESNTTNNATKAIVSHTKKINLKKVNGITINYSVVVTSNNHWYNRYYAQVGISTDRSNFVSGKISANNYIQVVNESQTGIGTWSAFIDTSNLDGEYFITGKAETYISEGYGSCKVKINNVIFS